MIRSPSFIYFIIILHSTNFLLSQYLQYSFLFIQYNQLVLIRYRRSTSNKNTFCVVCLFRKFVTANFINTYHFQCTYTNKLIQFPLDGIPKECLFFGPTTKNIILLMIQIFLIKLPGPYKRYVDCTHREQEGIILGSRRSGAYLWNLAIYSIPKEFRPSTTLIIASNIPLGH